MQRTDKSDNKKMSFMAFIARAMNNTSLGFYLAFSGVVLQFVHNLLAVAGTFGLFNTNDPPLLVAGEWVLTFILAYFLGMSLLYFTLKAGSVGKIEGDLREETKEERRKTKSKYNRIVNWFQAFDTLIDLYFWIFIVFMGAEIQGIENIVDVILRQWPLLIVVIPVVVMLPQTLRFYANEIEFKTYLKERNKDEQHFFH